MDQTITSAPTNKNDYAKLKILVQEAGLLETQGRYYAVKLAYTLAMLGVGVGLMFLLDGWARVLVAPYVAFVCAQLGFLAHDLGHKQVFGSTWLNNWAGRILANLLVGMSLGWWNDKHNAHHANPNHHGMDPDVDIPFMAFSEEQAMSKSGLSRLIAATKITSRFCAERGISYHVTGVRQSFREILQSLHETSAPLRLRWRASGRLEAEGRRQ